MAAYAASGARSAGSAADQIREVYNHWRQARGRTHHRYESISPARRSKIDARLREFSTDELKRAIDAVELDPWSERRRHDDLTIIFRSREQVERFLEFSERPDLGRVATRTAGLSAQEMIEQARSEAVA